jgi:hypothetical protein
MSDEQPRPKRKVGRPPKNDTTSARAIELKEDKLRAWELRKQGLSYREIAKRLNVSVDTAYRYITENTNNIETELRTNINEYRATQLDDIERAINILWQQVSILNGVNSDKKGVGDNVQLARARADTIRALNSLLERQARLLGLDMPTKIEQTGREIHFVMDMTGFTSDDNGNS